MSAAGKNITVLMVEDLEIAQISALNLFKQLNCNLHIVSTAVQALDQVIRTHHDIIFIDIQLPDINGFELALTIRNIERRWTRIPLIAVTANFNEELEVNTKNAGFDYFLLKPLSIESVRHVLQKYIHSSKLKI